MILVTLGTQDKPFTRLLDEIESLINKGIIKDEVIVQAGMTKYKSNNMKIFDLIPRDEFEQLVNKCDLLITHGGAGSILTGVKKGKVVIAVPRLVKYKEHQSNHQIEIIHNFSKEGYIIGIDEVDELGKAIKKATNFKPNSFKSNTNRIIDIIDKYIKSFKSKNKKVLFISSTGGHLEELLELNPMFKEYDYHIITEKTKSNTSLDKKYPNKVNYLIYGTRVHPFIYFFKLLGNGFKSLYFYIKIRPKYIVTTGTHTAIPMCILGKIFRSKIIYIETFANSSTKTQTGSFLYKVHLYNLFIVQWEEMLKLYPKAIYGGWIF